MMKSPHTNRPANIAILIIATVALSCSHPESKSTPETVVLPASAPASSNAPSTSAARKEENSLEYMLASIDAGGHVSEKDTKVIRIRYLLKSLSERTGESQYEISNSTAQTANYFRENYGKEIKNLELMEKTNKLLSSKAKLLMAGLTYREAAMVMAKSLSE